MKLYKYQSSLWDTLKFPKFRKRACTGNVQFGLGTARTGLHVPRVRSDSNCFSYIYRLQAIASAVQLHLSELVETQTVYIIGARLFSPLPIIFRSHNRSSRFDKWIELAKAQLILCAVHTLKRSTRPFGIFQIFTRKLFSLDCTLVKIHQFLSTFSSPRLIAIWRVSDSSEARINAVLLRFRSHHWLFASVRFLRDPMQTRGIHACIAPIESSYDCVTRSFPSLAERRWRFLSRMEILPGRWLLRCLEFWC